MERKVRSDKKKQVAPTVSVKLKSEIERLATILDQPLKFTAEKLAIEAVYSKPLISDLSQHFQEGALQQANSVFFGSTENKPLPDRENTPGDRVSIRFIESDWENMLLLSGLLRVTPSRAVATLLERAMASEIIVLQVFDRYCVRGELDARLEAEKRKLLKRVNKKKRP